MISEDKQFIISIIEKFNSSNISELELDDGTVRLVLKKETGRSVSLPESSANSSTNTDAISGKGTTVSQEKITSPIVGTFYAAPSADAPPFVKPGVKVKAGQILCILEAMKMMNKLEAEFDCEIIEVLAGNGELVEYGQDLFVVKKL